LEKGDIDEIRKQIEKEIKDAHLFAKNSPYPEKSELKKYIFA
jgi:TPP-dependent pyruvate/acetoin dehydrogenase alpha subunit